MAKEIFGVTLKKKELLDLPVYIGKNDTEYINLTAIIFEDDDDYGNSGKLIQTISKEERAAMKKDGVFLDTLGYCKRLFSSNKNQ